MFTFWNMSKIACIHQRNTSYSDVSTGLTVRPGHFLVELAVITRKAEWSPEVLPHVPARVSVRDLAGTRIIYSVSDQ